MTSATVALATLSTGADGVTTSNPPTGISVLSRSPARRRSTSSTARAAARCSTSWPSRAARATRPSATVSFAPVASFAMAAATVCNVGRICRLLAPAATTGASPASEIPGLSGCIEARAGNPAASAAATSRAHASP